MKVLIYYFTGTGNSLHVARKIAERLEGSVFRPITELASDPGLSKAQTVGFVFPVYYDKMPHIVRKVIERSMFDQSQSFFAAVTSGGLAGNALYELDGLLRSHGVRLDFGRNVDMSDNSIALRTPDTKAALRLEAVDHIADEIAGEIRNRSRNISRLKHKSTCAAIGKLTRLISVLYYNIEERKVEKARCSHCGLCEQICPVNNITIRGQEVIIGDNCESCYACINWCPGKAIVFGRIDPLKKQQYRCPGITTADIVRNSG